MSDQTLAAALSALLPQLLTGAPSEPDDYTKRMLAKSAAYEDDARKASDAAVAARPKPQDINSKAMAGWLLQHPDVGMSPKDLADRDRLAMQDAGVRDLLGASEFIGPPQAQPWDNKTSVERLGMDRTIESMDKAMQRAGGGNLGGDAEYAQFANNISPEQALAAARYKMSKQGMLAPTAGAPPIMPDGTKEMDDAARLEHQYDLLAKKALKAPKDL